MLHTIAQRVTDLPWDKIFFQLENDGFSPIPAILSSQECLQLKQNYETESMYRNVINMSRYRFGQGEYKYFSEPLPLIVSQLRISFYPYLAKVANDWMRRLGKELVFPEKLGEFLTDCHNNGQIKPTPLILRYEAGGYNCLHQDVYGDKYFPFQLVVMLSGDDEYTGGQFLLIEQRPRAQSIGHAIPLRLGEGLIFPTQIRPVPGKRGYYQTKLRHGVSRIQTGKRYTLGIIFHDAE